MDFLTHFTGPPIPTAEPLLSGAYRVAVTKGGFVIGDPQAFQLPSLAREIKSLPTGSGFIGGHLHLHSTRFPMHFPGASPRLLLVSRHLTVMPLQGVPEPLRRAIEAQTVFPPDFKSPGAELLRNVLPAFEIYQDAGYAASPASHRLSFA